MSLIERTSMCCLINSTRSLWRSPLKSSSRSIVIFTSVLISQSIRAESRLLKNFCCLCQSDTNIYIRATQVAIVLAVLAVGPFRVRNAWVVFLTNHLGRFIIGCQDIGNRTGKVSLQFFRGADSAMRFVVEVRKHFDRQGLLHFSKSSIRDVSAFIPLDFLLSESLAEVRLTAKMVAWIPVESIPFVPFPMWTTTTFVFHISIN